MAGWLDILRLTVWRVGCASIADNMYHLAAGQVYQQGNAIGQVNATGSVAGQAYGQGMQEGQGDA